LQEIGADVALLADPLVEPVVADFEDDVAHAPRERVVERRSGGSFGSQT
jgi:hypothetical protein